METKTVFTVRYAETDRMGIVHHSNYAVWFEVGRTEFLKSIGFSYSGTEDKGILLPLYEMKCKFISPAKYEDEIMVITTVKSYTRVRMIFSYKVLNADNGKLIATGETMHAWTDKELNPVNAEKFIPDVYTLLAEKNV